MILKQTHYISGIVISLFVGSHLTNHIFSIFGANEHIQIMDTLRQIYRNPIIETLLLSAVMVQIISGLKLFQYQRKQASSNFEKLHIWSGLYLAIFLIIHVSAVLAGRLIFNLDTNFYFGVAGLNTWPLNLFFIPYYSLGIIAFFCHIAAIHSKKMKLMILGIRPNRQSTIIYISGILLCICILFGLTNHFKGVDIPETYNVIIGK